MTKYKFVIYYDNFKQFKILCTRYDYCEMVTETFINEVIGKDRFWKVEKFYDGLLMADVEVNDEK